MISSFKIPNYILVAHLIASGHQHRSTSIVLCHQGHEQHGLKIPHIHVSDFESWLKLAYHIIYGLPNFFWYIRASGGDVSEVEKQQNHNIWLHQYMMQWLLLLDGYLIGTRWRFLYTRVVSSFSRSCFLDSCVSFILGLGVCGKMGAHGVRGSIGRNVYKDCRHLPVCYSSK